MINKKGHIELKVYYGYDDDGTPLIDEESILEEFKEDIEYLKAMDKKAFEELV